MAGFSFGNIKQSTNRKDVGRVRHDHVLHVSFKDTSSPNYMILTDFIPGDEVLKYLLLEISRSSIKNYVVASCINTRSPVSESSEGIDLSYILSNESQWRRTLKEHGIVAVLAMGGALYSAQGSTDTLPQDYVDDSWHEPRCFLSEEFCRAGDLFYYPSFGLDSVFPFNNPKLKGSKEYSNYRTKFFKAQLERMASDDQDPSKSLDMRPYSVRIVEEDDYRDVMKSLMNSELLAIDTETSGFDRMVDVMGCVSLSNDGVTGYYVPERTFSTDKNFRLLNNVFRTAKKTVLVNAKFDVPFLWRYGISRDWLPTDDAMLLAHALDSTRPKGLKPNAIFDTKFGGYDEELDRVKRTLKIDSYLDIPEKSLSKYAALDAIVTWRLHNRLVENMERIDKLFPNEKDPNHSIEWWYSRIMMPKYRYMIEMEFEGAHVDEWALMEYREKIREAIREKEDEVRRILGAPSTLDLTSTESLGYFLLGLGWPIVHYSKDKLVMKHKNDDPREEKKQRTEWKKWDEFEDDIRKRIGRSPGILHKVANGDWYRRVISTSDNALTDWEIRGLKGIKELKDLRSLNMGLNMFLGYRKDLDSYVRDREDRGFGMRGDLKHDEVDRVENKVSGWEKYIRRHIDGTLRFHTNFNAFGAETFRHKSRDPNTQQIPSRGMLAKFVCPVLTCPTKIKYTVVTDGDPVIGYGNVISVVERNGKFFRVALSQLREGDHLISVTDDLAPDHLIIQEGSIGKRREFVLEDVTGSYEPGVESRVVKSISTEKEPEEYYLVSLDLASAQIREASIDQHLNQNGIDEVMYELYGTPDDDHPQYGSLFADMHSVTAYNTFVKTVNQHVFDVHDDVTGVDYLCYPGSELWVNRAGEKMRIYVEDLQPTDTIEGYEVTRDK